ncbi:RNA polymerase sigma factor [Rhizobium sp. S152]|uniref:RNA polymerase sigma factor n=1 Tax=Rhizobium sp. S152 TaxID=3055038 RepID=UPI0025A9F674|nr:RNA polymerase sigma factor [Rhizobium sp. S152]MDM9627705.1 RNA polymerase sigma factor [Rhizobium sp. S152]
MDALHSNSVDELLDIYFRQEKDLRSHLQRRVGSTELAEDAMQETWIKLASMESLPPIGNKLAYLLRIAGNIATDLHRKERRHTGRRSEDDSALQAIADDGPTPETVIIQKDLLKALTRSLLELPPNCRAALLMSRCDDLTHREIASRLKVSESMVAKYLAQALRHCRDIFRSIT